MELIIVGHKTSSLISEKFIRDFVKFLKKKLFKKSCLPHPSNSKLTIAFVSSKTMRHLNKTFLKKDWVTDVLSFSPVEKNSLGELALCEEKIKSQVKRHHLSVEEEAAYLILHGSLHLLGYHHEEGGTMAEKMYSLQDKIFLAWIKQTKGSK